MTAAGTPMGRDGEGRGGDPHVPAGLRRSERGQLCRRKRLARPNGHIPLQGPAETAAQPPAPGTQAGGSPTAPRSPTDLAAVASSGGSAAPQPAPATPPPSARCSASCYPPRRARAGMG